MSTARILHSRSDTVLDYVVNILGKTLTRYFVNKVLTFLNGNQFEPSNQLKHNDNVKDVY